MKLFYVAVMALSLGGCASTNTKDQYPDSCEHFSKDNRFFNSIVFNRAEDINKIKVETSKKIEFYEQTPLKVFSGIESANLSGSNLELTLLNNGLFEQYSAPLVDFMIQSQSKSNLFGFFPLPAPLIAWLITPQKMHNFTFGCTSRHLLSTESDSTRKIKTGKSEWKAIQKSRRILVSGFDKDYEFDVDADTSPGVIDLSSAILNTELTKNTTLKVTCLDCDLLGSEEQNLYKDSKTNIVLTHDFRPIKESLAESQKVWLAEETSNTQPPSTEQAKAVEQSTKATPSPVAEPSEQPTVSKQEIERAKETCINLGFKIKTEKFDNCFLRLTK